MISVCVIQTLLRLKSDLALNILLLFAMFLILPVHTRPDTVHTMH